MRTLLVITAAVEAATGLALLVFPPLVVRLLLGAEIAGAGITICRVGGIALIALGIACWPGADRTRINRQASSGMLAYNAFVALLLAYIGLTGEPTGHLFWPAVAVHAILTVALALTWSRQRGPSA